MMYVGQTFPHFSLLVDGPDGPCTISTGDFGPVTIITVYTNCSTLRFDREIYNGITITYPNSLIEEAVNCVSDPKTNICTMCGKQTNDG